MQALDVQPQVHEQQEQECAEALISDSGKGRQKEREQDPVSEQETASADCKRVNTLGADENTNEAGDIASTCAASLVVQVTGEVAHVTHARAHVTRRVSDNDLEASSATIIAANAQNTTETNAEQLRSVPIPDLHWEEGGNATFMEENMIEESSPKVRRGQGEDDMAEISCVSGTDLRASGKQADLWESDCEHGEDDEHEHGGAEGAGESVDDPEQEEGGEGDQFASDHRSDVCSVASFYSRNSHARLSPSSRQSSLASMHRSAGGYASERDSVHSVTSRSSGQGSRVGSRRCSADCYGGGFFGCSHTHSHAHKYTLMRARVHIHTHMQAKRDFGGKLLLF